MSPTHQNGNNFESSSAGSVIENNECETNNQQAWEGPAAQGLYDPANEHEACGVGFIVAIDGKRSHKVCRMWCGFAFDAKIENHRFVFLSVLTVITRCAKIIVAYESSWRMRL